MQAYTQQYIVQYLLSLSLDRYVHPDVLDTIILSTKLLSNFAQIAKYSSKSILVVDANCNYQLQIIATCTRGVQLCFFDN